MKTLISTLALITSTATFASASHHYDVTYMDGDIMGYMSPMDGVCTIGYMDLSSRQNNCGKNAKADSHLVLENGWGVQRVIIVDGSKFVIMKAEDGESTGRRIRETFDMFEDALEFLMDRKGKRAYNIVD